MMKVFQRAVRRAGLNAEYSHGFNPQMQMVFGAPLSLGFTSDSEYADFSFSEDYEPEYVLGKLNESLPSGLMALGAGVRSVKKNIMADISYAGYDFDIGQDADEIAGLIMKSSSLLVEKIRKGRKKVVDVREMVIEASGSGERLSILVMAGNMKNLNPRLLVDAINQNLDLQLAGSGYNRNKQYVEREGKMVDPLDPIALETK